MSPSRPKRRAERSAVRRFAPAAGAAAAALVIGTVAVQIPADNEGASSGGTAQSQPEGTTEESAADARSRSTDQRPSRDQQRKSLASKPKAAQQPAAGAGKAPEPPPEPTGSMFATTDLNIRTGPGDDYDVVTTVDTGTKLKVTDETDGEWAEVVYDGDSRWVTAQYLADTKPEETSDEGSDGESDNEGGSDNAGDSDNSDDSGNSDDSDNSGDNNGSSGGLSTAECSSGSSVESGLTENAIAVHRAVCAQFPEVTSYGGLRPGDGGEHGSGRALDIMISGSTGDQIADFVRSNAGALGVSEVLWEQQIWTVQRSSEGWRPMEDRGSTTANHYDHVHVTVY